MKPRAGLESTTSEKDANGLTTNHHNMLVQGH